jgi:F0F1-type ATP synthase delta subunit
MTNQADNIVKTILNHLNESGQMGLIASVVDGLRQSSEYKNSINHVVVTSAIKLSPPELKIIEKYLNSSIGESYDLVQVVDQALLAGFTLQVNDLYIDASVLGKINTVSNILTAKD